MFITPVYPSTFFISTVARVTFSTSGIIVVVLGVNWEWEAVSATAMTVSGKFSQTVNVI